MIKKLNLHEPSLLRRAWEIQRESYEIEAMLIGSRNIPPLHESLEQLRDSNEKFFGFFVLDDLVGFVAIEEEQQFLRISRIVVSPKNFRNGIGKQLVQFLLDTEANGQKVLVSTGERNQPATALYKKLGFWKKRNFEIEGILISEFEFKK